MPIFGMCDETTYFPHSFCELISTQGYLNTFFNDLNFQNFESYSDREADLILSDEALEALEA